MLGKTLGIVVLTSGIGAAVLAHVDRSPVSGQRSPYVPAHTPIQQAPIPGNYTF